MGFRFRKSINFGGFRINLSKTGIGYSWGFPGYRHTITANGRTRDTYSLPGTGLSYVEESSQGCSDNNELGVTENYSLRHSSNLCVTNETFDEFIHLLNSLRLKNRAFFAIFWIITISVLNFDNYYLLLIPLFFLSLRFIFKDFFQTNNFITFSEENIQKYSLLNVFLYTLSLNKKLYYIPNIYTLHDSKHQAGATGGIKRKNAKLFLKNLKYLNFEFIPYTLKIENKSFTFLPHSIVVDNGFVYSKLDYAELNNEFDIMSFVETQAIPRDAKIVGHTWRYANKKGGPDKRFKNNYELPICNYGKIRCFNNNKFDITLMYSNIRMMDSLNELYTVLKSVDISPETTESIGLIHNGNKCPICNSTNINNKFRCNDCGFKVERLEKHFRYAILKNQINKICKTVVFLFIMYYLVTNFQHLKNLLLY